MPSGNHVVHGVAHEAVKSGSWGSTRHGSTVVSREMRKNIRGGSGAHGLEWDKIVGLT
jgi:hypothetical protein